VIHVKDIKKLYQVFQNDDIDKIEIRNGDDKLSFTINSPAQQKKAAKAAALAVEAAAQAAATETPKAEEKPAQNLYELKSKWIGFFIRINPKSGENYVKLRDVVKKGEILGHVRVLGVLQDLKSEQEGKLKEVLVEEGQPIEYGQPLMRFEIQN
jgi:acetyl-CoA carboxylase biotin carboxyl carrier protein